MTGPITTLDQVVIDDIILPPSVYTTVRGRVVAGDGITPIAASVALTYAGGSVGLGSGGDGRFEQRIALPATGEFTVRATSQRNSAAFVESSHTATTQGATVDVGDLVLPVSIISGRVTYGTTTPVPYPNMFAFDAANNQSYYSDTTTEDGTFTFVGLPAGTFTITANDDYGLERSIEVTLTTDTSVVTNADIRMPELATLNVHVLDRTGNEAAHANAIVRIGQDFERSLGWFNDSTSGGTFTLTVPLGDVVVEGEVLSCADPEHVGHLRGRERHRLRDARHAE